MTQNFTRQKYIKTSKLRDKWGYYDAQPLHVREWLQAHPLNIWPGSYDDLSNVMADTDRQYLLGLESVWGADHPAVIDARRRVVARNRKAVEILSPDDLSDLF